ADVVLVEASGEQSETVIDSLTASRLASEVAIVVGRRGTSRSWCCKKGSSRKTPMAESRTPIPLAVTGTRAERIFPTLTEAQMQRLASHGNPRSVRADEVLVELGDKDIPVFLVMSGELEV